MDGMGDTYSSHGWELKECLFDAAVVVHVNRVFKHEVDEVWVGLDELIELLQVFELTTLLLVKNVEIVLRGVQLHVFELVGQIGLLLRDLLVALLQLLFLFLERADLLVDLLLHHLVKILLLNLQLFHDAAEGLLQPVNLIIELLAHFQLQLRVELLACWRLVLVHLHLGYHFLHHSFHVQNY